jgi:hypothetical protein
MNKIRRAAPMSTVQARSMRPLRIMRLRTYGSRIRWKLKNVYSLKPTMARIGSSLYCCEAMA